MKKAKAEGERTTYFFCFMYVCSLMLPRIYIKIDFTIIDEMT